jgi:hypothetical protein
LLAEEQNRRLRLLRTDGGTGEPLSGRNFQCELSRLN